MTADRLDTTAATNNFSSNQLDALAEAAMVNENTEGNVT